MYYYSIDQIVHKTALTLNIPEEKVRKVIKHTFKTVKEELITPTHPIYFLEDFGNFSITPHRLRTIFEFVHAKYRDTNDPKYLLRLKKYAYIRPKVSAYFQSRKFKKRFGSWHWKPTTKDEAINE